MLFEPSALRRSSPRSSVIFTLSTCATLLFALANCSSEDGSGNATANSPETQQDDKELVPGFHPPPAGANDIRIVAPMIHGITAGRDVTFCTYIANPFGREVDVIQSLGFQSKYGHHALLMEVPGSQEPTGESHECTEKDMTTARFLAGGSDAAQNIKIPEGIAFRISSNAKLMVQTHWINTSGAPVDGATVFNVAAREPDPSRKQAQLFTALTLSVDIPARSKGTATTECTLEQDLDLFDFGGHAHEWGTHVKVERIRASSGAVGNLDSKGKEGGEDAVSILYDKDWHPEFQSNPPLDTFEIDRPLSLKRGDVLRVTCDYQNTEDHPLSFPREMCVAFGFYFPATKDIQCIDGKWITL